MSDLIINVSDWIRENLAGAFKDGITDKNELEILAYLSMAMFKSYLVGSTSHKWSEPFKKMISQLPKEMKELIR